MNKRLLAAALVAGAMSAAARADYRDDIDFDLFQQVYGSLGVNGQGVRVAHVEAHEGTIVNNVDIDLADGRYDFRPDPSYPEYQGPAKNFNVIVPSGTPGVDISGHANAVGLYFYGNQSSIAPGISDVDVYLAESFAFSEYLRTGQAAAPRSRAPQPLFPQPLSARIANHSWVGDTDPTTRLDLLERLDWVIDRDNFIQVVGVNNGVGTTPPLLAASYNSISVGLVSGNHADSPFADAPYAPYRVKPDVVVPEGLTSFATPVVSAAAALLIQHAHANPGLSNGTDENTRDGQTIYHGETSQTIKAVILAGARRDLIPSYNLVPNYNADAHYGAGVLNIYNSFEILNAGEQDAAQDGGGPVGARGWDFNESFGGMLDESTASYAFSLQAGGPFTASLVWNAEIDINKVIADDLAGALTIRDLNLYLYRVTQQGDELVQQSINDINNVEHLYINGLGAGDYRMDVVAMGGTYDVEYALAWTTIPEPGAIVILALGSLGLFRRRR